MARYGELNCPSGPIAAEGTTDEEVQDQAKRHMPVVTGKNYHSALQRNKVNLLLDPT
jgi:hypothetical protein